MIQRYKHVMIVSIVVEASFDGIITRLDETLSLQEEDDGYMREEQRGSGLALEYEADPDGALGLTVNNLGNGRLSEVDDELGLGRGLVFDIDTGETLQRTISGSLVDSSPVGLFAMFDRGADVDLKHVGRSSAVDEITYGLSRFGKRGGRGSDDGGTGSREFSRDESDPSNVGVLVLGGLVVTDGTEILPDGLTEQQADASSSLLLQDDAERLGDGIFTRVVETGQEDDESLLETRRVRLSQDLDDGLVTEPIGDGSARSKTLSKFGTRDIGRRGSLGDLVHRLVLVGTGEVGHHLEGDHFDVKLILVLGDELLRIIRSVKVLSLRVFPRTGVISTDDKVSRAKVLSNDGVPYGLPRSSHPHGEGQQGQSGHPVRVLGHQGLVSPDSGVVIDITGLGQTDDGVDEDVGLMLTSRTDGQLSMSSVHRVSGLEGHDLPPRDFLEMSSEFSRGEPDVDIVKVLGRLDGLDFTTDVEFLDVLPGVGDGRVSGVISAHDLFSLESLVESVNVLD
jgi:hypothetical protein